MVKLRGTCRMDDGLINVEWLNVIIALGLVAVAIGLSYFQGFGIEKDLIVGVIRSVLQLAILGWLLVYVFNIQSIWLTVLILVAMGLIASFTAKGRMKRPYPGAIPVLWISITAGSFFSLAYITILSFSDPVALTPRYLIPLGGMAIGNVLNGITLASERFHRELKSQKDMIEVLLSLGADAYRAAAEPMRHAFTAALIPTINALMVIGLIQIPGVMVGLVMSNQDPQVAARYQLMIMFMLVGAKVISVTLGLRLSLKKYFTPEHQLRSELL